MALTKEQAEQFWRLTPFIFNNKTETTKEDKVAEFFVTVIVNLLEGKLENEFQLDIFPAKFEEIILLIDQTKADYVDAVAKKMIQSCSQQQIFALMSELIKYESDDCFLRGESFLRKLLVHYNMSYVFPSEAGKKFSIHILNKIFPCISLFMIEKDLDEKNANLWQGFRAKYQEFLTAFFEGEIQIPEEAKQICKLITAELGKRKLTEIEIQKRIAGYLFLSLLNTQLLLLQENYMVGSICHKMWSMIMKLNQALFSFEPKEYNFSFTDKNGHYINLTALEKIAADQEYKNQLLLKFSKIIQQKNTVPEPDTSNSLFVLSAENKLHFYELITSMNYDALSKATANHDEKKEEKEKKSFLSLNLFKSKSKEGHGLARSRSKEEISIVPTTGQVHHLPDSKNKEALLRLLHYIEENKEKSHSSSSSWSKFPVNS